MSTYEKVTVNMHTYQPSRESLDIPLFDLLFRDPGILKIFWDFALFHQRTDHIVDIHNIYEINLIPTK